MSLHGLVQSVRMRNLMVAAWASTLFFACQSMNEEDSRHREIMETQIQIAQKQLDSGKAALALQTMKPLVKAHPQDAEPLNMMGIIYLALDNPQRALEFFRKAYKAKKATGTALNISSALIAAGDTAAARKMLRLVLKDKEYSNPERVLHNLALTYEKDRSFPRAITYYEKALAENPAFYLSHLRLAEIYKRQGDPRKSLDSYRSALQYCSVCYEALEGSVHGLTLQGKNAEAVHLVKNYIKNKEAPEAERARAESLLVPLQARKP